MKFFVCTPHIYTEAISAIADPGKSGKPCYNEIQYTFSLVTPGISLSTTLSTSIKPSWTPSQNPTPFPNNIPIVNASLISSSKPTSDPS